MNRSAKQPLVLGFPDYREPAARLAAAAGLDFAAIDVHTFPDGESLVRLPQELPASLILFTSLDHPNRRLIELELAAATALQLGAQRLTLVAPYLGYMRQDIAFHPGEAVSQRIVGELLARRFDTVITVDPHLHRTRNLQDAVPVRRARVVSAAPVMAAWLAARHQRPLLVGPDAESSQWLAAIAAPAGLHYGVSRKHRLGDNDVEIRLPELEFAGRDTVLIDDVASTGHTLAEAARELCAAGAASVTALVTHALFVGDALQRMRDAGVSNVCSTDSIPHPSNRLRLAALLSEALQEG